MTSTSDSARAYLRRHGYPEHVVAGGLEYLVVGWEKVAHSVAGGRVQFQDDYLNDMDGRHVLWKMLPELSSEEQARAHSRVAAADAVIRPHLTPTKGCLWGTENERKYGYRRDTHWWYYHRPNIVEDGWRDF